MFVVVRAATYATLFIGLLLVFVPRQILTTSGLLPPPQFGPIGIPGVAVTLAGAALALWCIRVLAAQGERALSALRLVHGARVRGGWRLPGTKVNQAETSNGAFPLEVWRSEKRLTPAP